MWRVNNDNNRVVFIIQNHFVIHDLSCEMLYCINSFIIQVPAESLP